MDRPTDPNISAEESHRANSADTCVYGALPVPRLRGFLSEEEVHFVVVSVDVVGDEVSSDKFRIWKKAEAEKYGGKILSTTRHSLHYFLGDFFKVLREFKSGLRFFDCPMASFELMYK